MLIEFHPIIFYLMFTNENSFFIFLSEIPRLFANEYSGFDEISN